MKNIIKYILVILVITIGASIAFYFIKNRDEKIFDISKITKGTTKIVIVDTLDNINKESVISDEKEVNNLISTLNTFKESISNSNVSFRYEITLYNKDKKIAEMSFGPMLKVNGHARFLDSGGNYLDMSKYSVTVEEAFKDITNGLNKIKKINVKTPQGNDYKLVKKITDEKIINNIKNDLLSAIINDGTITIPSVHHQVEFLDKNDKIIAKIEDNDNIIFEFNKSSQCISLQDYTNYENLIS